MVGNLRYPPLKVIDTESNNVFVTDRGRGRRGERIALATEREGITQ